MPLEFWLFDGPGVVPLVLGAGSEGRISRASADRVEMCRPRRQMAVEEWHTVGALEQLDLRISVPLKGARIAYKGLDHLCSRNEGLEKDETRSLGRSVVGLLTKPFGRCWI